MTDEMEASISIENSKACRHNVCDLCCFLRSRHLPLGKARHLVARAFALPTTGCALRLTLSETGSESDMLARARDFLALAPARSCRALSCAGCGSREGLRPPDAVAATPRATDAGVYIAKLTVSFGCSLASAFLVSAISQSYRIV